VQLFPANKFHVILTLNAVKGKNLYHNRRSMLADAEILRKKRSE